MSWHPSKQNAAAFRANKSISSLTSISLISLISLFSLSSLLTSCTPSKAPESSSSSSSSFSASSSSSATHAGTSHENHSSAPLVSKLKATCVLDDMLQYAIDSVEKSKYLGAAKKGKTASEGADFFIVKLRVRNGGKQAQKISTDNFLMQTADGPAFSPSDNGKSAVLLNGGPVDLFESAVNPGVTKDLLVIFDMPSRYIETGADLIIPSNKPGSSDRFVYRLDNSKKH